MAKLLGPFPVAFGDLQIAKDSGSGAIQPPLLRFYYPCSKQGPSKKSRWLPSANYAFGFLCNMARPTNAFRRCVVWALACVLYVILWPGSSIAAAVAKPILDEDNKEERFPVVVFSHGLWACRTTYSTLCSDIASFGYVVVAPEHLDGSANVAAFVDNNGNTNWVEHKYADASMGDMSMEQRAEQLKHRVKEIALVLSTLEKMNTGGVRRNLYTGEGSLDLKMFERRMDLDRITIAGHSFGGATSAIVPGVLNGFKCSLSLDAWWEPVEKVDFEKVSGKIPVLLLNTESFDWKALEEARVVYLNARAREKKDGEPLVTKLIIIKGTRHQDQSDLPLFMPGISKKLKLSGELDIQLAKDINSRACLEFLQRYIRVEGQRYPSFFEKVESDKEHLVHASDTKTI